MLLVALAIAVSVGSAATLLKRLRRLQRVELPSAAVLVERARAECPPGADAARLSVELDDVFIDIDGDTRSLPELTSALARVALASGTALSLFALASNFGFATLPRAGACFGVGVVGAMVVSYLGRMASARSRAIRAHWSEAIAKARRQIGATSASENSAVVG